MKKVIGFLSIAFLCQNLTAQAVGGWGTCEFPDVATMNAYNPSTIPYNCKKVFVQSSNEHYRWNGIQWMLESADVENIYNNDNTISGDRAMTLGGNDLTVRGSSSDIVFKEDGKLGIGTSTPSALLDVAGGTVQFSNYGDGTNEANSSATYQLAVKSDGEIVSMSTVKTSRIFYPPPIVINAGTTGINFQLDLHQEYINAFGTPSIASLGAPSTIPYYAETELYYYITTYDTDVFANVSISDDGIMSYDIISVPTDSCTFLGVIFVVK